MSIFHKPVNRDLTLLWWILIVIVLIIMVTFMIPRDSTNIYSYQVGEIARQTIIAPYSFDLLKSDKEIEGEKQRALENTIAAFNFKPDILNQQSQRLEQFFQMSRSLQQRYQQMINTGRERDIVRYTPDKYLPLKTAFRSDSIAFNQMVTQFNSQFGLNVTAVPYNELYIVTEGQTLPLIQLEKLFVSRLVMVYNSGIIDVVKADIPSLKIGAVESGEEVLLDKNSVFEREAAITGLTADLVASFPNLSYGRKQLMAQLPRLFVDANLIFDKERTVKRQEDALSRIPIVQGKVLKDEKIVDANTRITEDILTKLNSLNRAEAERQAQSFGMRTFERIISDLLIVAILYSVFLIFLYLYRREYLGKIKEFGMITIFQALSLIIGYFLVNVWNFPLASVPVVITALLLTIFFDVQIAIMGTLTVILLLAQVIGTHFQFILLHIFPMIIGIWTIRRMRTREQIFKAMVFIFLAYALTIIVIQMTIFTSWSDILNISYFALINSVVTILGTYGLVSMFERLFDVTTDMTLLELSDLNRPILRELAIKAPGTYHHSVMVGNLAETAAEAIGANSLLARVGAYYHDIGKISKSEYFVENQQGENKLTQLKPHMAAKVVMNHVREGVELADRYKLPQAVKDFIVTHHGTSTVAYFLDQARKEAEDPNDVDENDFRYHGPKPFTRETGLLMIVESLEAAVRSLKKPTYQNILQMVEKLIKKRLLEGELDDTPLTMADLTKIQDAVLPILQSMHHLRIEYPEEKKAEGRKNE